MIPVRRLYDDERPHVLDALQRAAIADPALCRWAVDEAVLIAWRPNVISVRGPRSAVAYAALRGRRATGITLGRRIFVRHEAFTDDRIPMELLTHEVVHVVQFARDGVLPFLARYLAEYASGLARGMGDRQSYLNIGYEIEARRVASLVQADVFG